MRRSLALVALNRRIALTLLSEISSNVDATLSVVWTIGAPTECKTSITEALGTFGCGFTPHLKIHLPPWRSGALVSITIPERPDTAVFHVFFPTAQQEKGGRLSQPPAPTSYTFLFDQEDSLSVRQQSWGGGRVVRPSFPWEDGGYKGQVNRRFFGLLHSNILRIDTCLSRAFAAHHGFR